MDYIDEYLIYGWRLRGINENEHKVSFKKKGDFSSSAPVEVSLENVFACFLEKFINFLFMFIEFE